MSADQHRIASAAWVEQCARALERIRADDSAARRAVRDLLIDEAQMLEMMTELGPCPDIVERCLAGTGKVDK